MRQGTDAVWDELEATAARLTALSTDTVTVWAFRRGGLLRVTEGLEAGDKWVHGLRYPIRTRLRFTKGWSQAGSIEPAASEIATFLGERPDLREGS